MRFKPNFFSLMPQLHSSGKFLHLDFFLFTEMYCSMYIALFDIGSLPGCSTTTTTSVGSIEACWDEKGAAVSECLSDRVAFHGSSMILAF
jgi:hypothetical protein